jgi:hypothetical protein
MQPVIYLSYARVFEGGVLCGILSLHYINHTLLPWLA